MSTAGLFDDSLTSHTASQTKLAMLEENVLSFPSFD